MTGRLKMIASLIMVVVLTWFVLNHAHELRVALQLHPLVIAGILGLFVAMRASAGQAIRLAVRTRGITISMGEGAMLGLWIAYGNLWIPRAGFGLPAIYMNKRYQLDYLVFGGLVVPFVLIQVGCLGALGLVAVSLAGSSHVGVVQAVFATCAVIGVVTPYLGRSLKPNPEHWLGKRLEQFAATWQALAADRSRLAQIVAWQFAVLLLRAARLYLLFTALGHSPSWAAVLSASLLSDVAGLVAITPGALGFREAALATLSDALQIPPESVVAISLVDRALWTFATILLVHISFYLVGRPTQDAMPS